MVENTGLESLCIVSDDAAGMRGMLNELMTLDFTENDIALREKTLRESFSNEINVQKLINLFDNE
jgi:hypothetical protein